MQWPALERKSKVNLAATLAYLRRETAMLSTVTISVLILMVIAVLLSWNILERLNIVPPALRFRAGQRLGGGAPVPYRVAQRSPRRERQEGN
jgi:hypothetical protein